MLHMNWSRSVNQNPGDEKRRRPRYCIQDWKRKGCKSENCWIRSPSKHKVAMSVNSKHMRWTSTKSDCDLILGANLKLLDLASWQLNDNCNSKNHPASGDHADRHNPIIAAIDSELIRRFHLKTRGGKRRSPIIALNQDELWLLQSWNLWKWNTSPTW